TTLEGSTLTLASNNVIPTASSITLMSGALRANTTVTLSNASTTFGAPNASSQITIAGSNPILFTGGVTLAGVVDTLNVGNAVGTTLAGALAGSAVLNLNKSTSGTLYFPATASGSYSGVALINAGIVNVSSATGLGASSSVVVAGTGAALQLQNGINFGRPLV